MGWSGGTFTRVHDWTEDEAGGYDILSTRMDEEDDNFETGINNCLTKDGTNSPTSDLPMGARKHTGVGVAQAYDQYATAGQVQNGSLVWPVTGITGGSLNAYTLTLLMAPTAYYGGQMFSFKANRSNSGATTLNVNSLGAKNVYYNGAACAGGEIVINKVYTVIYDGTQFHLMGGGGGGSGASYGGAKIYLSSDQTLLLAQSTTVDFNTPDYDDSNYYTVGTNYLRIPVTGRYRLSSVVLLSMSTPYHPLETYIYGIFRKNGVTMNASAATASIGPSVGADLFYLPVLNFSWEGTLTQNDQITVRVHQRNYAGGDLLISGFNGSADSASWLAIERIK